MPTATKVSMSFTATEDRKIDSTLSSKTGTKGTPTAEKVSMSFSVTKSTTDWAIDGRPPSRGHDALVVSDFEHTHDRIRLTYRSPLSQISQLRAFNDNAGDIDKVLNSDGGWDVIDRSDSGARMQITPPSKLLPTFVEDTYYLSSYTENPASELGRTTSVTLTAIRDGPRDPEDTNDVLTQSQEADDWLLEFQHGTIATPLVVESSQQSQTDIQLRMNLDFEQAEVILENATYVDAVSVETVPDGDDFVRDNNPDSRNTVTLTRPTSIDSEYLPTEGDYVVRRWTLRHSQPFRYDVDMTVRKV